MTRMTGVTGLTSDMLTARGTMIDLLVAVLLLLNTAQLLRTARPAPDPWKRRSATVNRPPALSPTAVPAATDALPHAARRPAAPPRAIAGLSHGTDLSRGRPADGGRGAPRRRGRRGGVQWRRHGDIGGQHLIVGQLNVQSLLPKLPDIRADIEDRYSFDLLMLCETWLSETTPDRLLNISGYQIFRKDRPLRGRLPGRHGGVAIYVRESYETEVIQTPVTGIPHSNLEILWVTVRVGKCRRLLLGTVYRVPKNTVEQVTADLDDLEAQLQHMIVTYPDLTIVVGGDINCCLLKPGASTPGGRLRALLTLHGLQSCNTHHPTYRPASSLLDILATNRSDLVARAGVTRCHYGTPHDFSRVALRLTNFKRRAGPVTQRRSLARIDTDQFNSNLLNADWTAVYSSIGPERKWLAFLQVFQPLLDSVAPVRRVSRRLPGAPPASQRTCHLLELRRTALCAGRRDEYKDLNRQARSSNRADYRRDLQQQLARGEPSSMWRVLRPVIGSKKDSSIMSITAEALNDYYVSVAPDIAATVPAPTGPVLIRLPRVNAGGLKVQPITMETLWTIVQGMKSSSFEGTDGLSVKMVQNFFLGFGHILHDLVNASLVTGRVPSSWKHAIITPIPKCKKKSASDPTNTRPISMLPAITKITERAVQLQLTEFMESHHLLSESQHGYRKNYSCETALHVVTDDILRAMDAGEVTLWAMVDLSKCFDMVPHDKLLDKLCLYGVDPFWFADYLRGHTQQVQTVNGVTGCETRSSVKSNSVGVYQGGSMSCILWSIYANDLCLYVPEDVRIVQFADDTQIWTTGKKRDLPQLISRIEMALQCMLDWFSHHGMKVNAAKTELMLFGTKQMLRDIPNVSVRFSDVMISCADQVRNLGVIIDKNLSFQSHVDKLVPKCTGMLLALNHTKHILPYGTLKHLITALVFSTMRYCMSVYGICGQTQKHRIQKIINFAARVLSGRRKRDRVSDVISDTGWLRADELIVYHRVVAVTRVLTHQLPAPLVRTIGPPAGQQHQHNTRGAGRLVLPQIRTEAGRNRLNYSGVTMYNDLAEHLNGAVSAVALKNHLRSSRV